MALGPRRVVAMAGIAVGLSASDDARWRALDLLFGSCRDTTLPPTVTLTFATSAPPTPVARPAAEFSDVSVWFTDLGVVTRHASGLVVQRRGDHITAGGPDIGDELPRAFRRCVQHVLVDVYADHRRFALHAAALGRDERAVVVVGDTGAGKSTLAVAAATAGWSVLTDDIAWLTETADGLAVTGFPKPLHVPAEVRDQVPDADVRIVGDDRGRYASSAPLTVDERARRLVGVIEVRHGTGDGAVAPIAPGRRLLAMAMASFPLQLDPSRLRRFFPIAWCVAQLPGVVISHAGPAEVRSRRAAELLDEAWRALLDQ